MSPLLDPTYSLYSYFKIDLSVDNSYWINNDVSDIAVFEEYLQHERSKSGGLIAHGGFKEQRALYRNAARFQKGIIRDVHMGVDLWAPAGTSVHALMDGTIHSFADNNDPGNYGPTLIIKHEWNGTQLYTLYGHLSKTDMSSWNIGATVKEGQAIATLGKPMENGGYSPHLHFQVMRQMNDYHGDFPGVLAQENLEDYNDIILDPNPFIFN